MRDFEDKVRRRTATLQVESGERSGALLKRGEQLLCTLVAYLLVVCNTELLEALALMDHCAIHAPIKSRVRREMRSRASAIAVAPLEVMPLSVGSAR